MQIPQEGRKLSTQPIILVKLLGVLIDISKNLLSENIRIANQAITEGQVE